MNEIAKPANHDWPRTVFGVVWEPRTYLNVLYLLISLPLGTFYFVFLVTGLALGIIARQSEHRPMAIWGIVLSSIALVIALLNAILGAYLAVTGQHPMFQ